MSSYQLDESGRGFSFNGNEPLDMRMDPDTGNPASHLVNNLAPQDLERILRDYGEEKKARVSCKGHCPSHARKIPLKHPSS